MTIEQLDSVIFAGYKTKVIIISITTDAVSKLPTNFIRGVNCRFHKNMLSADIVQDLIECEFIVGIRERGSDHIEPLITEVAERLGKKTVEITV